MIEPLLRSSDFVGFPGAPFTDQQVEAACDQVRRAVDWHIAPEVTETLVLDADGGPVLFLPTLHLVAVTAVRDVTGPSPRTITGWRKSRAGMLSLSGGRWPAGYETVEVDVVHGHRQCPAALVPLLAELCQQFNKDGTVRQESLGSRSVSYGLLEGSRSASVLDRFKLGSRP